MPRVDFLNLGQLDSAFKQFRDICTGQYIRIYAVLPPHVQNMPVEYKVQYLVDQLMFSLTAVSPCASDELKRAETWLIGIVQFLLTRCNEDDQTFYNIAKLFRLPYDTRQYMFEEPISAYAALRSETKPPAAFEQFDAAVFFLLESCGKTGQAKDAFLKFTALLDELKADIKQEN